MKRKIGEKFKTHDGVELEVCEQYDFCNGCYFFESKSSCTDKSIDELLGFCNGLIFRKARQ